MVATVITNVKAEKRILHKGNMSILSILACDVNGDGEITSGDMIFLKALILGKLEPTEETEVKADINGDGEITSGDVSRLRDLMLGNKNSMNEING